MPRMARSQSLPLAQLPQRVDDDRLVRSASPRRRQDDDDDDQVDDAATASRLGRSSRSWSWTSSPIFLFLLCAAAPASSFVAHVAGTVAWALVIGRAEVGAFAGIFWLMEALGGALGIAGVVALPFLVDPPPHSFFGVLALMHVALLDYSRRQLEARHLRPDGGASRATQQHVYYEGGRRARPPWGRRAGPAHARGTSKHRTKAQTTSARTSLLRLIAKSSSRTSVNALTRMVLHGKARGLVARRASPRNPAPPRSGRRTARTRGSGASILGKTPPRRRVIA